MPNTQRKPAQHLPRKLHPGLVALFAGATVLAAVLFVDLPPEQKPSRKQLRQDARRDVSSLLEVLRHE